MVRSGAESDAAHGGHFLNWRQ